MLTDEQIEKVLKTCGGRGWRTVTHKWNYGTDQKQVEEEVVIFGVDATKLVRNKRKLQLPDLEKKPLEGEICFVSKDGKLRIYTTAKCRIVDYKEEVIPARPERVVKKPVYDCTKSVVTV